MQTDINKLSRRFVLKRFPYAVAGENFRQGVEGWDIRI